MFPYFSFPYFSLLSLLSLHSFLLNPLNAFHLPSFPLLPLIFPFFLISYPHFPHFFFLPSLVFLYILYFPTTHVPYSPEHNFPHFLSPIYPRTYTSTTIFFLLCFPPIIFPTFVSVIFPYFFSLHFSFLLLLPLPLFLLFPLNAFYLPSPPIIYPTSSYHPTSPNSISSFTAFIFFTLTHFPIYLILLNRSCPLHPSP